LDLWGTRSQGTGEDCTTRKFSFSLLTKYSGDHITKNEMSKARGMYGGEARCIQCFGWETWVKETTLKTGVDGRIILKWIFKNWNGAWSGLAWLKIKTRGETLWKRW
jgi:hypothetical protein